MKWEVMRSAPKDGTRVDLYAKCWQPGTDDFIYARFPDCYWRRYATGKEVWENLSDGWFATHWMPLPAPPEEEK